jgi:hypothetical protein
MCRGVRTQTPSPARRLPHQDHRRTLAAIAQESPRLAAAELIGREIDTAGDGFFASFDGPARAIRCACAITEAMRDLGLDWASQDRIPCVPPARLPEQARLPVEADRGPLRSGGRAECPLLPARVVPAGHGDLH